MAFASAGPVGLPSTVPSKSTTVSQPITTSPGWLAATACALPTASFSTSARGVGEAQVREVIEQQVEGRTFGVLGQPRVNVLLTNRALDARFARPAAEG